MCEREKATDSVCVCKVCCVRERERGQQIVCVCEREREGWGATYLVQVSNGCCCYSFWNSHSSL